jgi:hypothetical protein
MDLETVQVRTGGGERGSAIVVSLLVLSVLMLLGGAFLTVSLTESMIVSNQIGAARAFHLAEAGLAHGRLALADADVNDVLHDGGGLLSDQPLGAGSYDVSIRNNVAAGIPGVPVDSGGPTSDTDGYLIVTATGSFRNARRALEVAVKRSASQTFEYAVYGENWISAHGSGKMFGHVRSDFNIIMNAWVVGDATAGGSVSNPSHVSGTVTNGAPRLRMDPVTCPLVPWGPAPVGDVDFDPVHGDLVIDTDLDVWFPESTYFFNSIRKKQDGRMRILAGQAVDLFVKKEILIEDGGFDNPTFSAEHLKLWGCSPNDAMMGAAPEWRLEADHAQWMVIYAPAHPLRLLGPSNITGSLVGKSVFKSGTGNISYDGGLGGGGGTGAFELVQGTWSQTRP